MSFTEVYRTASVSLYRIMKLHLIYDGNLSRGTCQALDVGPLQKGSVSRSNLGYPVRLNVESCSLKYVEQHLSGDIV